MHANFNEHKKWNNRRDFSEVQLLDKSSGVKRVSFFVNFIQNFSVATGTKYFV